MPEQDPQPQPQEQEQPLAPHGVPRCRYCGGQMWPEHVPNGYTGFMHQVWSCYSPSCYDNRPEHQPAATQPTNRKETDK